MTQGLRLVTQPGIQRSLLPLQQQQAEAQATIAIMQQAIGQLQATLAQLAPLLNSSSGQVLTDILTRLDDLTAAIGGKAAAVHTHPSTDIADLVGVLDGKAAAAHTHPVTDITGLTMGGTFAGNLKFPTTQNPSFDPNTLDDYEEGIFNPALMIGGFTAGITYTVRSGRYIKIGRLVNVQLSIALTSKGMGTGAVMISGLPFPAITSAAEASVCIGHSNIGMMTGYIASNTSRITLVTPNGAAINQSNLTDSAFLKLSASYETTS
jgi:Phage tail repeat like